MYGAWEQYLGLEHPDTAPRKAHTVNQVLVSTLFPRIRISTDFIIFLGGSVMFISVHCAEPAFI